MTRPSWDEYFKDLVDTVARRSTCDRGRSGAVIVINNKIITTGYAGSPPGQPHCDEVGHLMREVIDEEGNKSMHCIRTLHAEENAILQAAEEGKRVKGATLFCSMTPCYRCAKMIVTVGIVRVVAKRRYHAERMSVELFKEVGVQLDICEDKVEEYEK